MHKPLPKERKDLLYPFGFTLIELLVSVAIIAILSTVSLAALQGFGNRQTVKNASGQIVTDLRKLAIDAFSGVKDNTCDGPDNILGNTDDDPLVGHYLYMSPAPTNQYEVGGACNVGGNLTKFKFETKTLPASVNLVNYTIGPDSTILFKPANQRVEFYNSAPDNTLLSPGLVGPQRFEVTDATIIYRVTVDYQGKITQEKLP